MHDSQKIYFKNICLSSSSFQTFNKSNVYTIYGAIYSWHFESGLFMFYTFNVLVTFFYISSTNLVDENCQFLILKIRQHSQCLQFIDLPNFLLFSPKYRTRICQNRHCEFISKLYGIILSARKWVNHSVTQPASLKSCCFWKPNAFGLVRSIICEAFVRWLPPYSEDKAIVRYVVQGLHIKINGDKWNI